jgi:hypothetical protein
VVDRVLASYRLHTQSKTNAVTDADRLEQAIQVSRRYWGSPAHPMYWQIMASYLAFRFDRRARAVRLLRSGRDAIRQGSRASGLGRLIAGAVLAPDVVGDVAIFPAVRPYVRKLIGRPAFTRRRRALSAQTEAYLSGTDLYGDNWAGPNVVLTRELAPGQTALSLTASPPPGELSKPLSIEAFVEGKSLGLREAGRDGAFHLAWSVEGLAPGSHAIRLKANGFVVPHDSLGTHDYRPL